MHAKAETKVQRDTIRQDEVMAMFASHGASVGEANSYVHFMLDAAEDARWRDRAAGSAIFREGRSRHHYRG